MFSCEFFEISKNTFFTKHLGTTTSGVGEGPESVPPPPKICHTYPTMMKLGTLIPYLKKIRKIYKSRDTRDTPLEFCRHQRFFIGNQQVLLYQEIQIYIIFWYIVSNSFNFFWVFNDFFNEHDNYVNENCYSRPS